VGVVVVIVVVAMTETACAEVRGAGTFEYEHMRLTLAACAELGSSSDVQCVMWSALDIVEQSSLSLCVVFMVTVMDLVGVVDVVVVCSRHGP
jgi:hypothetical protein